MNHLTIKQEKQAQDRDFDNKMHFFKFFFFLRTESLTHYTARFNREWIFSQPRHILFISYIYILCLTDSLLMVLWLIISVTSWVAPTNLYLPLKSGVDLKSKRMQHCHLLGSESYYCGLHTWISQTSWAKSSSTCWKNVHDGYICRRQ